MRYLYFDEVGHIRETDSPEGITPLGPEWNEFYEQKKLKKEKLEAQRYLDSTDWYIVREMDTGTPCPTEIKTARAEARLKL
jgi:hypothetical protein